MGAIWIAVRMSPRKVSWARDGHLEFQLLIVGTQSFVPKGPISAQTIARVDFEIGWMKPGREGSPMNRSTSNSFAAVIGAESERIRTAGDAKIFPVKFVRTGFVTNPVPLRIPERTGFESYDTVSSTAQPL